MKVLFLDVDGVITHQHFKDKEKEDLDPEKIKIIARIVEDTGAFVVLTSSWRLSYDQWTGAKGWDYKVLEQELAKEGVEIYDITTHIGWSSTLPWRRIRPLEILDWLSTHDVQEYVIIDDDEWEFETYGMAERWIQTHTDLGITGIDAAVAIKILEGDC